MGVRDISLEGLLAPVRTVNCESIIEGLDGYLPNWPFTLSDMGETDPCAILAFNGTAWLIQSPHTSEPRIHKTPVNAVCDLLSILASAMIAQEPDLLCFHCAALEVDGGLVLFPAVRRSGKSTLAAVLMAHGAQLFTDDYLPVETSLQGGLLGRATGVAARLRLPLPSSFPADALAYLNAYPGPENKQYRYLAGPAIKAARERLPIHSIVLLDRQDEGGASLSEVSQKDLLGRLAHQNFSRGLPAGETLSALVSLTQSAPAQRLTYCDPDEAADLILSGLPKGTGSPQESLQFPQPGPKPDLSDFDPAAPYYRTHFASLREAGDIWVGASHDGKRILQFDAAAVGVLELLHDPLSPQAVAGMIAESFPAADPSEIEENTFKIMRSFLKVGYIART